MLIFFSSHCLYLEPIDHDTAFGILLRHMACISWFAVVLLLGLEVVFISKVVAVKSNSQFYMLMEQPIHFDEVLICS